MGRPVGGVEDHEPGEVRHAIDRILRCGRTAAPPLATAIDKGSPAVKVVAAEELALVAPDLAVDQLVDLLPKVPAQVRVGLRAALARATQSEASDGAVRTKLQNPQTPVVASVDLLRAMHLRPSIVKPAAEAVVRISSQSTDFRTRYLLLGPAAELARAGDPRAEALLVKALGADAEPHVRARAAQAGAGLTGLAPSLVHAIADADPRVRDAALAAIARGDVATIGAAVPGALECLRSDPWTFVRQHAAEVLARGPADPKVDDTLAEALEHDAIPSVRARLAEALGRRHARKFAAVLVQRLADDQEDAEVRSMAARALGRVCDAKSVELLTSQAQTASVPGADSSSQAIGLSAVAALGELAPRDLAKRLAPLLANRAAKPLREAAKDALETTERCPR